MIVNNSTSVYLDFKEIKNYYRINVFVFTLFS